MKPTLIIIALACLSTVAFGQENQKSDSTASRVTLSEKSFQPVHLNAPLYILDNKEITHADLEKIDADRIKSVTVLKDSSAVALYGQRGSKGVVIIQTKKGAASPANKKRSTIE